MIYLDNAATSRVFLESAKLMEKYLCEEFFNPSSLYGNSLNVKNHIEQAREVIAAQFSAKREEVVFTSCATESNNWVLNSGRKYKKGNVVTTTGEHPAVYETAVQLKGRGVDVRFATISKSGCVDEADLLSKIDAETALVSIIHCSNETGVINDLSSIVPKIRARSPRALIHSDGVQAFCKLDTNLKLLDVDFYSVSAHKVGGMKGVGALYIKNGINISPFIFGGGQESGMRSGTENTAGIMGFSKSVELYSSLRRQHNPKELYEYVKNTLEALPNVIINGDATLNSGYIISASISGIRGEILQHMLSEHGILIGLGSACSSKSRQNRVLSSMGRSGKEIEGSIRISFSVESTKDEVVYATNLMTQKIKELRNRIQN